MMVKAGGSCECILLSRSLPASLACEWSPSFALCIKAATSENFREGVTFGNDYDVIDVRSTMIRPCFFVMMSLPTVVEEPFSKWEAQVHVKKTMEDIFH